MAATKRGMGLGRGLEDPKDRQSIRARTRRADARSELRDISRWRRLTVAYVCAGAGAIGMVTFVVAAVLLRGGWPFNLSMLLEQLFTGLLMGLISGAIFCAVVRIPMRSV